MSILKSLAVVALSLALAACANRGPKIPANVRSSLERADSLIAAGQPEAAVPLYDQVLGTSGLAMEARGRALYGLAALRLSGYPAVRDLSKARPLLQELHSGFPSVQPLEVSAALWLLADVDAAQQRVQSEATARKVEAEYARVDAERLRASAQTQVSDAARAADASRQAAQRELADANARLAMAEAELVKKDEVLRRLTERMLK